MMKPLTICCLGLVVLVAMGGPVMAQRLFVGLESASLVTRSSDLGGFPNVSWTNHYPFEVNGCAATPDGHIYLCNGPFTTRLYIATLTDEPELVATVSVDVHGMGYGGGKLYGFSNYASPMGIYEIDPTTGQATLRVSTASQGYRFFGLDFNAQDGLLYGYTEYGQGGLYSIDPDTGEMVPIASYPPDVNGQGRALAVGNNTVYLLATRGDEGEPCFAYDLDQAPFGDWVPFTNPYPAHHNTGGATWIPEPADVADPDGADAGLVPRLWISGPNPATGGTMLSWRVPSAGAWRVDVFDGVGRWVTTLASDNAPSRGAFSVAWNGNDRAGQPVATGVYHARLRTEDGRGVARILVIR